MDEHKKLIEELRAQVGEIKKHVENDDQRNRRVRTSKEFLGCISEALTQAATALEGLVGESVHWADEAQLEQRARIAAEARATAAEASLKELRQVVERELRGFQPGFIGSTVSDHDVVEVSVGLVRRAAALAATVSSRSLGEGG